MTTEEKSLKQAISIILLLSLALLLFARLLYLYLGDAERFPVNTIKITANYQHVTHAQLKSIIESYQEKSFYTFPVNQLYNQLISLPWSAAVEIERIYPDTIKVTIKEKQPVAIWNNTILTQNGDYFTDESALPSLSSLPHFITTSQDIKTVLQMYQKMSNILSINQLKIKILEQRDNQAWEVILTNGIQLRLGKQDTLERVTRFSRVFPLLSEKPGQLVRVDLRYPEGMAAKWQP